MKTLQERSCGVLLHLSSLAGPVGNGDLGPSAHAFVGFLANAGQSWWQMLPISPTGAGDSPYQALSAFAGNPLFISLERLAEDGLLSPEELLEERQGGQADFAASAAWRLPLLRKAFHAFQEASNGADKRAQQAFMEEHWAWLDDLALYMVLRQAHQGRPWTEWEASYRDHHWPALAAARVQYAEELQFQYFLQFQFFRQWGALRTFAAEKGVGLIGDLPIFVSHDSADVWAHRGLFDLDEKGRPRFVAGVPPDYFSSEGQRWGNPLYRWDLHQATGFQWWVARLWHLLKLFDAVRIDHFIGFQRSWAVPSAAPSAREGAYRPGPGAAFFEAIQSQLGGLPIIAEDLGLLTPEVEALRRRFNLPGMKVLQFSFGPEKELWPDQYPEDSVAYTGTHDNDCTRGWLDALSGGPGQAEAADQARALAFVQGKDLDPVWGLIEAAYESKSRLAVIPAQDLLGLGSQARMNVPGTAEGNWRWRLKSGEPGMALAPRLRALAARHQR